MTANNIIQFPTNNTVSTPVVVEKPKSTYISTTDKCAIIRKQLKEQYKWSSRKVSVRADLYSGGSSINITVKHADVNEDIVEKVARQFESIDRCEHTGEILSGGNTYLHVTVTKEVEHERSEPYMKDAEVVQTLVDANPNRVFTLGDTGVSVARLDEKNLSIEFEGKDRTVWAYKNEDNTRTIAVVASQLLRK